jgi:hypothetical protein
MIQIIVDTIWQTLGVCAIVFIPFLIYLKNKKNENN